MKRKTVAAIIFFSLVFIYNSNLRLIRAGDTVPASLIPLTLAIDRSVALDYFYPFYSQHSRQGPFFFMKHKGHVYSIYPIALPLIISPLYLPIVWALNAATWSAERLVFLATVMEKLVASLISSLTTVLLFLLLDRITSRRKALILSLAFALCTTTWTTSSQALWQHGGSQLFITASMLLLWMHLNSGRHSYIVLTGLCAALAVAIRPTNIIFLLCVLVYLVFSKNPVKRTTLFCIFPMLIGAMLVVYNLMLFGDIRGVYGAQPMSEEFLVGLRGTLISPSRGLFVYSPFLIFSLAGIYLWFKGERDVHPALFLVSLGFVLGQTLLLSKYFAWWGGGSYGPRYMTDVLPCMIILLVPSLTYVKRHLSLKVIFLAAIFISFSVQMVGAFFYPRGQWNNIPRPVASDPSRLWNWKDSQILRTVSAGPDLTPYARLLNRFHGAKSDTKYRVRYIYVEGSSSMKAGRTEVFRITLSNEGSHTWNDGEAEKGLHGISLSYHWYIKEDECTIWDGLRSDIAASIQPGEQVEIALAVRAPSSPGDYTLAIDLVQEGIAWFAWYGNDPLRLNIPVTP